jgi:hypothetical protein
LSTCESALLNPKGIQKLINAFLPLLLYDLSTFRSLVGFMLELSLAWAKNLHDE